MAIVSKAILKSYFNKNDKPTEQQFVDLIDTFGAGDELRSVEFTLTTAQILASFTTPVEIIANPGTTSYIEIVGGSAFLDYNSATYATQKSCILLPTSETNLNNAGWNVGATSSFLFSTADARCYLEKETGAQQILTNTGVSFTTRTANPTVGDSPVTLYVLYRIITP